MQRTLIILKPDSLQRALVGKIISRFEEKGAGQASSAENAFPRVA